MLLSGAALTDMPETRFYAMPAGFATESIEHLN
jgi:hypothetical protein